MVVSSKQCNKNLLPSPIFLCKRLRKYCEKIAQPLCVSVMQSLTNISVHVLSLFGKRNCSNVCVNLFSVRLSIKDLRARLFPSSAFFATALTFADHSSYVTFSHPKTLNKGTCIILSLPQTELNQLFPLTFQ